jgi:hypothetical protein
LLSRELLIFCGGHARIAARAQNRGFNVKRFVLVLAVLGLVAAVGYLLGTESGRVRRDNLLARLRESSDGAGEPDIDLRGMASETAESAAATAEKIGDAIGAPS